MTATLHPARSSDDKTREVAGALGAILFGAASILEFVRLQSTGAPWPGFTTETDWIFSLLAIMLWVASAFVLARRKRDYLLIPILGAFSLLAFGLIGTIAGAKFGIVYILFAVMLPFALRFAFGSRLELGHRYPEPDRRPTTREVI